MGIIQQLLRYNLLAILCCFFLSLPLFSQEEILLKGNIQADSLNGSLINIVNLTQQTGTTNSVSGSFVIRVREKDTLVFSSVQYEVVEVIISSEIFQKEFLEVRLTEKYNQLSEVRLSNIKLSGNLERDIAEMKIFKQSEQGFSVPKKPPGGVSRKIALASGSPLELVINTLNGRLKMLKKAQELMQFDEMVDRGVNAVPKDFFLEDLHIPETEILNFVYYCAEQPDFRSLLAKDKHLELIENYFENAPLFLAHLEK